MTHTGTIVFLDYRGFGEIRVPLIDKRIAFDEHELKIPVIEALGKRVKFAMGTAGKALNVKAA